MPYRNAYGMSSRKPCSVVFGLYHGLPDPRRQRHAINPLVRQQHRIHRPQPPDQLLTLELEQRQPFGAQLRGILPSVASLPGAVRAIL